MFVLLLLLLFDCSLVPALTVYNKSGKVENGSSDFRSELPREFYSLYQEGTEGRVLDIKLASSSRNDLADGVTDPEETEQRAFGDQETLEITVQQSDKYGYISKVHLHFSANEFPQYSKNNVTNCGRLNPVKFSYEFLNDDTWLFNPPILTDKVCITFTEKTERLNKLTEVFVFKPVIYGVNKVIEGDSDENSYKGAKKYCKQRNTFLPSSFRNGKNWVGMEYDNKVPHQNDGTYNTFLTESCSGCIKIPDDSCALRCTVTEVEYYTAPYQKDLREACRALENGIPVTPSSELEIWKIEQKFGPDKILHVAACDKSAQFEPIEPNKGDSLSCGSDQKAVVVVTEGKLIVDSYRAVRDSVVDQLVLCKRLPVTGRAAFQPYFQETFNPGIMIYTRQNNDTAMTVKEVRFILNTTRQDYENHFAQVEVRKESEMKHNITLSLSKRWYKIPQQLILTSPMELEKGKTSTVTMKSKLMLNNFDIQFIEDKPKLLLNQAVTTIRSEETTTITCTVEKESYRRVEWLDKEGQTIEKGISEQWSLEGWQSAIVVGSPGKYTCSLKDREGETVVATVEWATTCDSEKLTTEIVGAGSVTKNPNILLGDKAEVSCDEGFSATQAVRCADKGVLEWDNELTPICKSIIAQELEKMEALLKSDADITYKSRMLRNTIKTGIFTEMTEISKSIKFMELIAKDPECLATAKSMMHIVEAVSSVLGNVSRLANDTKAAMVAVQDCMNIVDLIGCDAEIPIKLADNGVALAAVNINRSEITSDVTLAAYNISRDWNLDDLVVYEHGVNLSDTENVVLPQDFVEGRIWFTVYDNSLLNPTNDTASNVIGVSFKRGAPPDRFTATISLQKKYYGAEAECVFWNTTTRSWSQNGVTKVSETPEWVECKTTHLTSFSVLMTRDDSFIPDFDKSFLDYVSIAGVGISMVCLVATLVALLRFDHIRRLTETVVHVNFALSLLLAYTAFLVFIDMTAFPTACITGAVLTHYFFLCALFWMCGEALVLWITCRSPLTNNNHVKVLSAAAWGVPMLLIAFCIMTGGMGFSNYENPDYCWLKGDSIIFWFGVPALVIAVINIALYISVLRFIVKSASELHRTRVFSDLRSCALMLIVLGCTWILGFFTLFTKILAFHYLFSLANTVQGFTVFYCYCAAKQCVVAAWKAEDDPDMLQDKELTMESKVTLKDERTVASPPRSRIQTSSLAAPPQLQNTWVIDDEHF